jgi:MOSC domain-containing protein YiiM
MVIITFEHVSNRYMEHPVSRRISTRQRSTVMTQRSAMTSLPDPSSSLSTRFIASINVGAVRVVEWRGERVATGIWKSPVSGRVAVRGVNLVGDNQADRTVHGGSDKAVYAYAREDYDWWAGQLGHTLQPGTFGENLTVRGMAVTDALVGERWRVGSVLLEVSQPRLPCYKLGMRMNDPGFPRRFAAAGRPGAYLRILESGHLAAGDPVDIVYRPGHDLTVGDVAHIYLRDRRQIDRLLQVPELSEEWKRWAREHRRKGA